MAPWTAARRYGRSKERCWSTQKQGGEEGFESVAHGEAGEQISSSGRPCRDERPVEILDGRRRRWRWRRLHGALRLAWLGGGLQSEETALLGVPERRGGGGGYDNGGRWRR